MSLFVCNDHRKGANSCEVFSGMRINFKQSFPAGKCDSRSEIGRNVPVPDRRSIAK